jgi:hypothetical protein
MHTSIHPDRYTSMQAYIHSTHTHIFFGVEWTHSPGTVAKSCSIEIPWLKFTSCEELNGVFENGGIAPNKMSSLMWTMMTSRSRFFGVLYLETMTKMTKASSFLLENASLGINLGCEHLIFSSGFVTWCAFSSPPCFVPDNFPTVQGRRCFYGLNLVKHCRVYWEENPMDGFKPQESFGGEALIPTDSSTKNQSLHNSSTVAAKRRGAKRDATWGSGIPNSCRCGLWLPAPGANAAVDGSRSKDQERQCFQNDLLKRT